MKREMDRQSPTQQNVTQAIVLAHRSSEAGTSPACLLSVATLPVILRAILTAQRAGIRQFLVVVDTVRGPKIRQALERSRRLPDAVEWLMLPQSATSPLTVLKAIAERADEQFLLLPGEATFHSRLLDSLISMNGPEVVQLVASGHPTGIYKFSRHALSTLRQISPTLQTWHDLDRWLERTHLLQPEEVDDKFWQPIISAEDLPRAEAKLNQWLYKETDGIYARWNRRISIPISRLLIKLPITPNMVTVFTLLVSVISGVFFALGGYLHTLVGALLSHLACILDGSDGEVARLTFQESEFGCWLETVCDNAYYASIYTGMVIGMYRTTGSMAYPIAGILLGVGMLMSFIMTGYQRRYVARHRPEKYLSEWQKEMDAHRDNALYRFARRHEFLVRRSFLPYAILFFAIIDFMDFVLFMSALGANLVWTLALYSHRAFRRDASQKVNCLPRRPVADGRRHATSEHRSMSG